MSDNRDPVIARFCLLLCLAIALVAIGVVILFDYFSLSGSSSGRISLSMGGGLASLLIGTSLIAVLLRRPGITTLLASLIIIIALCQAVLPWFPTFEALSGAAISLPLLTVVLLTEISLLAAIHLRKGGLVGLVCGLMLITTGLLSFLSFWHPEIADFGLGTIPESTIIVSPLSILVGLALPSIATILRRDGPAFSPGLILVGVIGIALTTLIWHAMRVQNTNNLHERAEILADQVKASSAAAMKDDLALIRRLADRQTFVSGKPEEARWTQDAESYLNDFSDIQMLGILDPTGQVVSIRSRGNQYLPWLENFLQESEQQDWLDHVTSTNLTHISKPQPDHAGRMHAMIASPVKDAFGQFWTVFALTDIEATLKNLLQHYDGDLNLRVYYSNTHLFDIEPQGPSGQRIPLATRTVVAHHESPWRIEIYSRQGHLSADALYLPPLVLLTGLVLSFLMLLSHVFWRESERRSRSLQKLNSTVNAHLSREKSLRHANERIMEFSRDILCSINGDGIFTAINPASEDVLGYRPDQLIGESIDSLIPQVDQAATAEEFRKLVAGQRGTKEGFRNHLRHRDGHIVTVSWTAEWSGEDQTLFCVGRDMTDQLVAETLMRERDQFFSLSPDMFCIVDLNNHFFEVNKAFLDVLAYDRDDLLGASYIQLIHKDDRGRVEEAIGLMNAGHNINDLEIRAIDKNGMNHWLELSATLSADDLIYVAARDTTEMRDTQEKLRESETLLKIAEKAAQIGGWIIDVATGETRWSHAMFDIFEMPIGEVPSLEEGLEFYTPDTLDTVKSAVETCIETGVPFDVEVQILSRAGNLRWVRAIGQAVKDDDNRITRVQGGLQDVTASHQAMEQIRRYAERQAAIFESITDAFFTVDKDWRFTYVNQRAEELTKSSRNDLLGNTLWDRFPGSVGTEFEQQYRHAVETGESVFFEAYYEPLDNWLEVSAYPSDEGLAVYYRSINERKHAQQQLEITMAELERSNRELQDFAFVASHDLQEPLRKVQSFSDRLLSHSENLNDQERDYLQRMQSAAARMQSLIRDLLAYSRVTTRAKPLAVCDTNQILQEVLQDMETMIAMEEAVVETSPLPSIIGDATQIRQIFQNLLSNAVKFHSPGQKPYVRVYPESSEEFDWVLVISDNGVGFDSQYAEKLFLPFQRLHGKAFTGTGIGLAIVRKILDRHGAKVTVESRVDHGTTFKIHFPIRIQQAGSADD